MSDEVANLLSILGKEGYATMDCWMPTNPADKNNPGKFLNYLESTVIESMSWKMSRRGQMRQLMHSLIIYANLITMH